MSKRIFLQDGNERSLEQSRVVVLPVPHEASVSYGSGTSRGPDAILDASTQIESFNERMSIVSSECGIWTDAPLDVAQLSTPDVLDRIASRMGQLLDDEKWVVMLGGEHSITPGGVRAAAARHKDLHLVQFDAHADLRQSYQGDRFSHACAVARSLEYVQSVRAVGIRSYSSEEAAWMKQGIPGYRMLPAWEIGQPGWIERVLEGLDGKPVYLTFDVDYFDPSIMPATGTPEPGGGSWWPTLELLEALFSRANVVAADVVELAPIDGLHHADFTVSRLVYDLIGLATRGR